MKVGMVWTAGRPVQAAASRARGLVACVAGTLLACGTLAAAPPSEAVLPKDTVVYVSLPKAPDSADRWKRSSLGQFVEDPAMKPFMEDLRARLKERWEANRKTGLTWDDVRNLPTGELAFAISRDKELKSVVTLFVDVAGKDADALAVLARAEKDLVAQKGKVSKATAAGSTLTVFELPPPTPQQAAERKLHAPEKVVHFIKDHVLVVCTNLDVAVGMATRWDSQPDQALASSTTFRAVTERLRADLGSEPIDLRWFVRPIPYWETIRAEYPPKLAPGEPDLFAIAKRQNFHLIWGVGGYQQHLRQDGRAMFRFAAFAPDLPDAGALRMLQFVNSADHAPFTWIPRDVSSFTSLHWNLSKAFDGFGTMFDEYLDEGPGEFEALLQSVKEDPNGPQLDMRSDLLDLAGARNAQDVHAIFLNDYVEPFDVNCRQNLLAVPVRQPNVLRENIAKSMKGDPNVTVREFAGFTVFEVHDKPMDPKRAPRLKRAAAPKKEFTLPPTSICVAHGCLLLATHTQLLEKVLTNPAAAEPLAAGTKDFDQVQAALDQALPGATCFRGFERTAESLRPTWELTKMGKLYEDRSLIGRVLREYLGDDRRKKVKLDGSKLPEFELVRKHFGASGWRMRHEPQFGWFGKAVLLPPGQIPAVADQQRTARDPETDRR